MKKTEKGTITMLEVNTQNHWHGFDLSGQRTLQVVDGQGHPQTIEIERVEAQASGRMHVIVTADAEWGVIRDYDGCDVDLFDTFEALEKHLCDKVHEDPVALVALWKLGRLEIGLSGVVPLFKSRPSNGPSSVTTTPT